MRLFKKKLLIRVLQTINLYSQLYDMTAGDGARWWNLIIIGTSLLANDAVSSSKNGSCANFNHPFNKKTSQSVKFRASCYTHFQNFKSRLRDFARWWAAASTYLVLNTNTTITYPPAKRVDYNPPFHAVGSLIPIQRGRPLPGVNF